MKLPDWLSDLLGWLKGLYVCPDPAKDPVCRKHDIWIRNYPAREEPPQELGAFLLEHARRRYADSVAVWESANVLADQLLRTAGILGMILVAAAGAFQGQLKIGWSMRAAMLCFLAAMLLVLWSRRPLDCPMNPAIRDVIRGAPDAQNPQAWLATSLHGTVEGMKVVNRWRTRRLALAGALICVGVASLLPVVFSV